MNKWIIGGCITAIAFLMLHVSITAQSLQTVRTILNNVWDKTNHRLMTTPGVGAQGVMETEITILNDVWDNVNNMLRVSSGGGGSELINPMTTAGDEIVGGVSGVPVRVPLASQGYINPKLPPYNAVGDGVADDTVALQAALDAAATISGVDAVNGAGIVHLPPGVYRISSITVPKVVMLQSSNMFHGAKLLQSDGVNDDAVKLKCSDEDAWYYGGLRHVHIEKDRPTLDTIGSGVSVTRASGSCSLGETARISDLYIRGFPVSGLQVLQGSAPLRIEHVSTFSNGQFGVDLRGQHQTVVLDSISGDGNNTALINVDGTGSTYDATTIHIKNVKAETNTIYPAPGGPQETVVLLNTLTNARVTVENVGATRGGDGSVSVQDVVRVKGARAVMTRLKDIACSGACVNMFVDEINGFVLPWGVDVHELNYRGNGTYQIEARAGYSLHSLALGQNQPAQAGTVVGGTLTQKMASNGITLQTLTRQQDSAPTGSFVKYQTLAGADLWDVDVTGTLVTGRVPETRLIPQVLDQADVAGITVDCGLYNYVRVDELSQTTTFNAPTGCTPGEGQELSVALFSTTARTLSFGTGTGGFSAAYGVTLPTTSFTGLWVFYEFKWNATVARWVIVRATR